MHKCDFFELILEAQKKRKVGVLCTIAYAGVGELGASLARAGWMVTGIETDWSAIAIAEERAPASFAEDVLLLTRGLLATMPVVLDLSYERVPENPLLPLRRPYVDAVLEGAAAEFRCTRLEHESWPMLRLELRD